MTRSARDSRCIRRAWLPLITIAAMSLVHAQPRVTPALQAMAEAEREFARAATVKGIRDSFLEFFSDDSLMFTPGATPAKARLLSRPGQPFSVQELVWEPRAGDIAASGEMGWLTGPSTFINHAEKDAKPNYGNYLSVWKKQPDGKWRVFIDIGSDTPQPAPFAPGLTSVALPTRYAGKDAKAVSTTSLLAADRELNTRAATDGAGKAYVDRASATTRLHRVGSMPAVGKDAIASWFQQHPSTMSGTTTTGEAAVSGDLGYTYGTYELKGTTSETGTYVRVWTRDAAGRWWLAADVNSPAR